MFRLFGGAAATNAAAVNKDDPIRSLPASWYRAEGMFQLERRAIWSRKWILLTHTLKFPEAGAYTAFTYAGYSFFLVKDRDGNINGFHNVCRHRAYPVVEKKAGTAQVLACKYHGWSYGLKGNLAKAPRFDTVQGFDKSQHGLLPVNVQIDSAGFIWVNLQAGKPDINWEDEFKSVPERYGEVDFSEYNYDQTWEMEVPSNWKTLCDNYNECYHCQTTHPVLAGLTDLPKYYVEPKAGTIEHFSVNKNPEDAQFKRLITFCYPSTSITVTDHFLWIQRMVPITATTCRAENEVYRHKNATDQEFNTINDFYKEVLGEDKDLCKGAQNNFNAGVFVNGELHPEKELGPIYFQSTVRKDVMEHRKREESLGNEIWPAVPKITGEMKTDKLAEEEAFCSKLDAESCGVKPEMAW